ncbi:Bifunctional F420 biosynthesis protein FbiB [subsurface metagenome]
MGEADEGQPVVVIRGYDFNITENTSIKQILRKRELDLFRDAKFRENFEKLLKSRRSYKLEFSNKKIEENVIKECIEMARWAPSAHNGQFWRYIIMEQGKLRETLIKNINFKLGENLFKDGKSKNFIKKKIEKTKNQFLISPYLILLCLDTRDLEKYSDQEREKNEYVMGVQSISASATYLLLAFEIRELAACWYCAPLFAKEIIKNTLNLPSSFIPMAFFTVGQSLKTQEIPKRKELKDIIFKV